MPDKTAVVTVLVLGGLAAVVIYVKGGLSLGSGGGGGSSNTPSKPSTTDTNPIKNDFSDITDPFTNPNLSKIKDFGIQDFSGLDPTKNPNLSKIKPLTQKDLDKRQKKSDTHVKHQTNDSSKKKKTDCAWYDLWCQKQKELFG